jgi:WD40 repeat protein/tRNA A-37 threonylcarbamoyl transferase component Bud32
MSSPATISEFLGLIRKGGLIDEQILSRAALRLPREPIACADALVESGLLTPFQAKHLLAGRANSLVLGPYRLLAQLGKGGMGVVYLAQHTALARKVAVKVLGEEQSREQLALERFYREARAAAALDHPNIVRLHDIARAGATHYLVMEYVDGTDLQALIDRTGPLHPAQAAGYIAQAAAGLAHAHERGFIHRDIKPANLIVDRTGVVKVLDMGLARSLTDPKDSLTGLMDENVITGTADFLSPEQALNVRLDSRTDIYSLGATLYTLLTARPPFDGTTAQKLAKHQTAEPPEACELRPDVPRELSAVIVRMMAKVPTVRYQTAREVRAALAPWVPGLDLGSRETASLSSPDARTEPHPAPPAPPNRWRAGFLWLAGSCLGVAAVLLFALLGGSRAAPEPTAGEPVLAPGPALAPGEPVKRPKWEHGVQFLIGHPDGVNDLVVSPDETRVASVDWAGKLCIWDARTGQLLHETLTRPGACCLVCTTTPDGRFILVAGERMPILAFEWATGREVREYLAHEPTTWGLAVSPSGKQLLSCGRDGRAILRSLSSGEELRRFECETGTVWCAAFSADGNRVATGGAEAPGPDGSNLIRVWSVADGKLLHVLRGHTEGVRTIAFRPDGLALVSGAFDGTVRLWNLTTGAEIRNIVAHDGVVERAFFVRDGRCLLTCGGPMPHIGPTSEGGAAKVWDADTGRELKSWRGPEWSDLICLAPSARGSFAAAGGRDRTVRLWSPDNLPSDRLVHTFELPREGAFRSRYQDGQHSDPAAAALTGRGVFLHCWRKQSVAEFRGEPEGRPSVAVTNLGGDVSSQVIFQFNDAITVPTVAGKRYRVRFEYRTVNEAEGRAFVRNPKNEEFGSLTETRLERTDGKWRAVDLIFRRPADGKIDVCLTNSTTGEGNTLAVRSVEVFEIEER